MKSTDWAAIIIVVAVSAVFAFVLGGTFISSDDDKTAQIEEVTEISEDFGTPNPEVFNDEAINLTQIVEITESESTQPFSN